MSARKYGGERKSVHVRKREEVGCCAGHYHHNCKLRSHLFAGKNVNSK
jgi:hypothetical protein